MEKINVSKERCIGCGACVAIDPEHFEFNDNKSSVISNENLESENLINAIESCPTSAIEKIEETENIENTEDITCDNEECDCADCNCENCDCNDECDCDDCDCECESHKNIETEDEEEEN